MIDIKPLSATVHRDSLGMQVYRSIRESIVFARLEPGQLLYENDLADKLGVSRTPIREAIRLLESEELIEVLPQRGTRVSKISVQKLHDAIFIRQLLETGAFRAAAALWRTADREAVRKAVRAELLLLLDRQRSAAAAGDIAGFLQLDEDFHHVIMATIGNETLLRMVAQMRAHVNRARCLALRRFRNMEQVIDEHRKLMEALEAGDESWIERLLQRHLGQLKEDIAEIRAAYPSYFFD